MTNFYGLPTSNDRVDVIKLESLRKQQYLSDAFSILKSGKAEDEVIEELRPLIGKFKIDEKEPFEGVILGFLDEKRRHIAEFLPPSPTLLSFAVLFNYQRVVDFLIESGANVSTDCGDGITSLMIAASMGNVDLVRKLVTENKADVNERPGFGLTALAYASIYGQNEAVKFLLDNGALHDLPLPKHMTPLIFASLNGRHAIADTLLDHGAKIDAQNEYGETALICAASEGDIRMMDLLLARSPLLEIQDCEGYTAIAHAVAENNIVAFGRLLNAGAELHRVTKDNKNLMNLAAESDAMEMIRVLKEKGVDLNHRDREGQTAILRVASHGLPETLKLLLDIGADPELKSIYGQNALMASVLNRNIENMDELLSRGCRLSESDFRSVERSVREEINRTMQSDAPDKAEVKERYELMLDSLRRTHVDKGELKDAMRTGNESRRLVAKFSLPGS